jgi:hypothetical protein
MNDGIRARERFTERMQRIAVGARLEFHGRVFTVRKQRRWGSSVDLTLCCAHRTIRVPVMLCHSGPDLSSSRLRFVAHAPAQREMSL